MWSWKFKSVFFLVLTFFRHKFRLEKAVLMPNDIELITHLDMLKNFPRAQPINIYQRCDFSMFEGRKIVGPMLNSWWAKEDSPLDVMGKE